MLSHTDILEAEHAAAVAAGETEPKLGMEGELLLEDEETPGALPSRSAKGANMSTPAASRRESFAGSETFGSGKRRGRPKGWTDARIHAMLSYLERNMVAYRTLGHIDFYAGLCTALGYDLSDVTEIMDKCEKMVKKYESDTRRGDPSWKWYARLNQVFDGPPMPAYGMPRNVDDDAASSSLESCDDDDSELGPKEKRPRGEDPFQDRLEHEKLLLKLKKLKSKTEMRHREWEASVTKQAQGFEDMKSKTVMSIARLEKAIVNAGYLLDQAEILSTDQPHQQ